MYAALHLPRFRLQAALRWRHIAGSAVVVDGRDAKAIVLEANAAAQAKRIFSGQTVAQAMARDLGVLVLPRSDAEEAALAGLLLETAQTLSADVEQTAPAVCIADLRRRPAPTCWQSFGDGLRQQLSAEQIEVAVGLATTPDLALLAARGGGVAIVYDPSAFAATLPVEAMELSREMALTLKDWGIATVGELLRLPRTDLLERLGPEAEAALRRVSGRHRRPLKLVHLPPGYHEAFDFEHEIESTEPILFLLRRFLEHLCGRLRSAHRVAQRLNLSLPLDDGTTYERSFSIPAPTTDVTVLYRILDTHLEGLRLEQRPVGVRLTVEPVAASGCQLGLFETALRDLNGFGETLARLKALLGENAVGVPQRVDSHAPDAYTLAETFPETSESTEPPVRGLPLRRFRPPVVARVDCSELGPSHVDSRVVQGEVTHCAGPYRRNGNWWDQDRWSLEEWDVALTTGGLYRLGRSGTEWRLEGAYEHLR